MNENYLVGTIINYEKYKFVDSALVAEVVRDTVALIEKENEENAQG